MASCLFLVLIRAVARFRPVNDVPLPPRRDSRKGLLMSEPEISAGSVTVFKDSQLLPKVRGAFRHELEG